MLSSPSLLGKVLPSQSYRSCTKTSIGLKLLMKMISSSVWLRSKKPSTIRQSLLSLYSKNLTSLIHKIRRNRTQVTKISSKLQEKTPKKDAKDPAANARDKAVLVVT